MSEIDDKLNEKLRQQMDGLFDEDEEQRFRLIAKSYAMCENSIAVLSNLRTDKSYIRRSLIFTAMIMTSK